MSPPRLDGVPARDGDDSPNGPPSTIGVFVPLRASFVRTESIAVGVAGLWVFPDRVEFKVLVRARQAVGLTRLIPAGMPHPGPRRGGEWVFHVDARFVDERASTRPHPVGQPGAPAPNRPPTLVPLGFETGEAWCDVDYAMTPLPPPGQVVFTTSWPLAGVESIESAIDAGPLLNAAPRAIVVPD